jgi:protoporphyrin/coproporphyrin ferrochelatase
MQSDCEALLVVSFGGPEKPEDVMPFLGNVTRGRGVPRERLLEVAGHYYHFGGRSPINDQNRALIAALRKQTSLPVYWGNRNWHPFLADTVRDMTADGIRRAAAFITSAFGSWSGCRQYREDIERARGEVGQDAPEIAPLPLFYDHPGFVRPTVANVQTAIAQFDKPPHVAFTAHSVPTSMADTSPYVAQLGETCSLIVNSLGLTDWQLVYQSRSGSPTQAWLEPDILDHIRELHANGVRDLVIAPVGFISDHMEVLYDLDTEAASLCRELGMRMVRAATVGTHPDFVRMILELVGNRRRCTADCCPGPRTHRPPQLPAG